MWARLRSWLAGALRHRRLNQDLADEMAFHEAARADDLIRRGLSQEEASRQARLEFGAAERYKEECRESRGLRLLNELRGDCLYAVRGLRRSPGFAAVVVASLALGIGANTAIFSVVNGVLLRPLPYRDQDRLVSVREEYPELSMRGFRQLPPVNFLLRRAEVRSLEDMVAMDYATYQLINVAEPEDLRGGWVTANLCQFLGIQPVVGRCFTPEDEASQAQVTVLSNQVWRRQFGEDPGIVGKSITFKSSRGNKSFTVIGVLPPQFDFLQKVDLWMPLSESNNYRSRNDDWNPSVLVARLKPGVTAAQARTELASIQRQRYPKQYEGAGGREIVVLPVADYQARPVKTGLVILLGMVGLVLLITCANVANLLLSRGTGRVREMAVRQSLGAGRIRICRQLLTESLLLAAMGGIFGLVAGNWMVKGVKALEFARLPRVEEIGMDWRVLGFTVLVSALSGVLFGLAPALRLSRVDLVDAMKSGGAGAIGGWRQTKLMNGLAAGQVGLCVIAMMCAGLLINTFLRLKGVNPGFRSDRTLVVSLNRNGQSSLYTDALARVRSMPGVQGAGLTNYPPPYHIRSTQDFKRPGTADQYGPEGPKANARGVSPGYFSTMGIPVLRGRDFNERDQANSPAVILISEGMAKRYWPDENPIGKAIRLRMYRKEVLAEIIGVVGDVRQMGPREQPEDQIYACYTQEDSPGDLTLLIRTRNSPLDMAAAVKREVRAIDKYQTFRTVTTLEKLMADDVAEPRFYMLLLGVYGALALGLTALGIGGLVAYSVSRRTREIGLRISFGATKSSLLGMFASGSLKLVGIGLVIGVPASLLVTRYARSLLYEVTPSDPGTITAVVLVLAGISVAASVAAAMRATTIAPADVLRHD